MNLQRYRYYKKQTYWLQKSYAEHDDVSAVVFQKAGNVVIASFPNNTRLILNVSYPRTTLGEDGSMHAFGYLETDKGIKGVCFSPKEHWQWEPE